MRVLLYRLGTAVHWQSREKALVAGLSRLAETRDLSGLRLVDVGAGLGQLVQVARRFGLGYLGLEPDAAMRGHAEAHHPDGRFVAASARDLDGVLEEGDVLVLNGVAHHLPDDELAGVLAAAGRCTAVIVCDHWRVDGRISGVTRWLQDHDQGRHIRDYVYFTELPDLGLIDHRFFHIGPLGMPLWTYFCNVYLTERTA